MHTLTQTQTAAFVSSTAATSATIFRLTVRLWHSMVGLDDLFALLSTLCVTAQFVTVMVPNLFFPNTQFYLLTITTYAAVWLARWAVLLLTKCFMSQLYVRSASFLFFVFFSVSLAQVFWVCTPSSYIPSSTSCEITTKMATLQVITDIIADMSLILPTVYVLAAIPKSRCRMPIPVFSSCILPSVVSLIHLALVVTSQGQVASTIALVVKSAVSLAVCNLPIIAKPFYAEPKNEPIMLSPTLLGETLRRIPVPVLQHPGHHGPQRSAIIPDRCQDGSSLVLSYC